MKYIRLLRLPDQFIMLYAPLILGITQKLPVNTLIYWSTCIVLLSFAAFITNELVDRKDVDKYSWNTVHVNNKEKYNPAVITVIYLISVGSAFFLAYRIRLLLFALAIFIIGQLYSLPPIRSKGRFAVDLLSQFLVWWVLPFISPVISLSNYTNLFLFTATLFLIILSIFLPYQLADFIADKKAGLKPTHIVIGMKNSLVLGFSSGFIGLVIFVLTNNLLSNQWFWYFLIGEIYILYLYGKWFFMKDLNTQTALIQKSVFQIRPFSILLIPYLLFWYLR